MAPAELREFLITLIHKYLEKAIAYFLTQQLNYALKF